MDQTAVRGPRVRPNIPSREGKKWRSCFCAALYRDCNHIEQFFDKIKYFRRIATLGPSCLTMMKLVTNRIRQRFYESTV